MGSVLRGVIKMTAAGWIIEKLALQDPLHKTMAFGVAGVGIGYVESLLRQRKEADKREEDRER